MPARTQTPAQKDYAAALDAVSDLCQNQDASPLERLHSLYRLGEQMTALSVDLVQAAIDAGSTWQAIGDAAGLTKQGAHQHWSSRLKESQLPLG
jgi:hypothetical protein